MGPPGEVRRICPTSLPLRRRPAWRPSPPAACWPAIITETPEDDQPSIRGHWLYLRQASRPSTNGRRASGRRQTHRTPSPTTSQSRCCSRSPTGGRTEARSSPLDGPTSLPLRREPRGEGSCLARCVIAARRLLRLVGWSFYRVPTGIEGGRRQGRRPDTGAGPIRHDEASMDRLASRRNSSTLKPSRRSPRRTPRPKSRLHPPVSPSHSRMAMWALLGTQTCGKAQLIQPTSLALSGGGCRRPLLRLVGWPGRGEEIPLPGPDK